MNNKKHNQSDLIHFTYNPFKKEFLKKKGVFYIVEGIHRTTGKDFWVYLKNDELDQALKDWRKYQETKFN